MNELKLLLNLIRKYSEKEDVAIKTTIVIITLKYLIENRQIDNYLEWNDVTKSKKFFKSTLKKIGEELEIFNSNDIHSYLDTIEEEIFNKLINMFNSIEYNVENVKLVSDIRELISNDRYSTNYKGIIKNNTIRLAIDLLDVDINSSIIDSFSGYANVYSILQLYCKENNKDFSKITYYGQEINQEVFEIGQLIGYILGENNFVLKKEESIKNHTYINDGKIIKSDYVISLLPFIAGDMFNPFKYIDDKSDLNLIMIEHILTTINEKGKGAILFPTIFLSARTNKFIDKFINIRKFLIENDLIDCIIKNPQGALSGYMSNTFWIIINKNKETKRKNKIQFIDITTAEDSNYRFSYRYSRTEEDVISCDMINRTSYEYKNMIESDRSYILDNNSIDKEKYNLDIFEVLKKKRLLDNKGCNSMIKLGSKIEIIRRGVQLSRSRLETAKSLENKDYYLISLGNIVDGKIILSEEDKVQAENRWIDLYQVREGDIIITSKGSLLKIAIVDSSIENAILTSNLIMIRLDKNKYHPEILKYYFESEVGQIVLSSIMKGSIVKSISIEDLENIEIPDVYNQEKIASMIREYTEEYERIIREAEKEYRNKIEIINKQIGI